jgi:hypothetical protein
MAITLVQQNFRIRTDATKAQAGTPVWAAAQNVQWNVVPDTAFRIRFSVADTGTTAASSQAYSLFVSKNGGAFAQVPSTASTNPVFCTDATAGASLNNSAITTSLLTGNTGTFLNVGVYNDTGTTSAFAITASHYVELEFGLKFQSGQVTNGDTFAFRVYQPSSVALNTYTNTPSLVVYTYAPKNTPKRPDNAVFGGVPEPGWQPPRRLVFTPSAAPPTVALSEAANAQTTISASITARAALSEAASAQATLSAIVTARASIPEAANAQATITGGLVAHAALNEPGAATDAPAAHARYPTALSEAGAATDHPAATARLSAALSEAASAADALSSLHAVSAALSEAASSLDLVVAAVIPHTMNVEMAAAADQVSAHATFRPSLAEFLAALDRPDAIVVRHAALAEAAGAADAVDGRVIRHAALAEAANAQDALSPKSDLAGVLDEGADAQDAPTAYANFVFGMALAEAANARDFVNAFLHYPGVNPRSITLRADRDSAGLSAGRANPSLRADRT